MLRKKTKQLVLILLMSLLVMAIGTSLQAEFDPVYGGAQPMTFQWEPGIGTIAAGYDVEIRQGGSNSTNIVSLGVATNEVTFDVEWLTQYEVRVRGISDAGGRGPWSIWSDVYDRDHDAPPPL